MSLDTVRALIVVLLVVVSFTAGYYVADDEPEPVWHEQQTVTCHTWVDNGTSEAICFGGPNVDIRINPNNTSDSVRYYGNSSN